ncbi:RHS repeat-associated core domain-containing protein [Fluviicola sp.]|uniref:RHS repeat-associated core domain-containing protein n=1 Tax=Fluviicola sp. TaxID=1917219 RepID=UPI003D2C6B6E
MYIKDELGRVPIDIGISIVKFTTIGSTTTSGTEYFVYGTDRVARVTVSATTPLAKIQPDEATYFVYDHLGNTRVAFSVNGSNVPLIVNALDYYSYGKILRQYDNGDGDRYLTTGHERDQKTGLDYRGARYYDSDVARFLSTDPWANKYPAWSTYNYVMGNPISLIDPTGKGAESTSGDDKKKKKAGEKREEPKVEKPEHEQPKYIPPPKELEGFPGAQRLKRGDGQRVGWKLPSGNLGEWDSQHAEVEVFDKTGKNHKGAYDPKTGEKIKPGDPKRKATRSKMETNENSSTKDSNFPRSNNLDPDAVKEGAKAGTAVGVGTVILLTLLFVLSPG